ncbi:MAG: DNA-processing protein DprA [Chloroflexota bacterium]
MADTAWVALSLCKNLGGRTFQTLLAHFDNNLEAVLGADTPELRSVPGIGPKIAHAIRTVDLDRVSTQIHRWQEAGIRILTLGNPDFPQALVALPDAPPTLFVLGDLPADTSGVAVVGTRNPSQEMFELASCIGVTLAERGSTVVSGLAMGIDRAAHMGALAVPHGRTIAVLGGGILHPYPPQNRQLAQAIVARGGALVCEVAPDAAVSAPGLVARNRLITGLSRAIIVAETETTGGAMHAVRFGRTQQRPIYAVDNPSPGCRALLKEGAGRVTLTLDGLPN